MTEHRITFQPSGRALNVPAGITILEAALRAGIPVEAPCGGGGTCGKCRVRVASGAAPVAPGACKLPEAELAAGWRLACATVINGPLTVEIPATPRAQSTQILTTDAGLSATFAPCVETRDVMLPPPTLADDRADTARLAEALGGPFEIAPGLLPGLPARLRAANWRVRAVLDGGRLLDALPLDAAPPVLGVAFDLGTTTVVGTLFNLQTGEPLAVASSLNGQISHGDDVVSRIRHAREHAGGAQQLRDAAVKTLNELLHSLTAQADAPATAVCHVTLAGNTAMQQLFLGLDSRALGEVPFAPVFDKALERSALHAGLAANPCARLHVFPQVGGFVGGDTVACMLAAGFDALAAPALLIDIGTNGEIALFNGREIFCASTAAGPAFEGARISRGMRAASGAIDQVALRGGDIACHILGNAAAAGLCGTALIDAAAELLRAGVLEDTGRLLEPDEAAHLPDALRGRVVMENNAPAFRLEGSVLLTQQDVRELQLATAAIRAGFETLLKIAGLEADALRDVFLAGAFGNLIRPANARRIGLLPQVPLDRIRFIGNASSLGAKTALLNHAARGRAECLRAAARHVELGSLPDFQDAFVNAMLFPEEKTA
ncbi:MAG: ASKHA domain-containing protein [Kiritimatiellaeota bacterium]|nr:ASKHA domain-containing protein [Kiritimatiellota bacterium]